MKQQLAISSLLLGASALTLAPSGALGADGIFTVMVTNTKTAYTDCGCGVTGPVWAPWTSTSTSSSTTSSSINGAITTSTSSGISTSTVSTSTSSGTSSTNGAVTTSTSSGSTSSGSTSSSSSSSTGSSSTNGAVTSSTSSGSTTLTTSPGGTTATTTVTNNGQITSSTSLSSSTSISSTLSTVTTSKTSSGSVTTSSGASTTTTNSASTTTSTSSASSSSKASTTTSSSSGAVITDDAYISTVLRHHNVHRLNHTVIALTWSQTLAETARKIASTCKYGHDTTVDGGNYGQNIGAGYLPTNMGDFITGGLYNGEVNAYTYFGGEPDFSKLGAWGHFSQIVWKETTTVGCYTADCTAQTLVDKDTGKQLTGMAPHFTVCNYQKTGNVGGAFAANVLKSVGSGSVGPSYGCPSNVNCVGLNT